jgi:hypothetical protein
MGLCVLIIDVPTTHTTSLQHYSRNRTQEYSVHAKYCIHKSVAEHGTKNFNAI